MLLLETIWIIVACQDERKFYSSFYYFIHVAMETYNTVSSIFSRLPNLSTIYVLLTIIIESN